MNKFVLLITAILLGLTVNAQTLISGKVSSAGAGLNNVTVSDGYSCVLTSSDGSFTLIKNPQARFVYISTPAGYLTEIDNSIPLFYKKITAGESVYDFRLKKNSKSDLKHTLYVQSDVQVADAGELTKYKEIVADAKKYLKNYSKTEIFGIDCGDIVGDKPALYPGYMNEVSALDIPIYRAMGNHDMTYYGRSFETSTQRFEGMYGPTYYSFNKGKAHYIIVNNNFYIGREYFYMGYLDEATLSWLEQDLKSVPEGSLVIMAMHIPTRLTPKEHSFKYDSSNIGWQTVNSSALFSMLKKYNTHFITGHMHTNDNVIFSPTMMEHNTGAACGTWWQLDECVDGTPCGYAIYEIDGDNIKWHFKSANYPAEYQFRAYGLNSSKEYPNDIIANVWNYDSLWKVEWLEDGKLMGEMTQFRGIDPDVVDKCKDTSKMKYSWISAGPTSHLFKATPKNISAKMEIRVTDRFGKVYTTKIK
ncbi:MAG: calcineurin-like phosphoesterase C-terminal domain-containing protein [Muribaculaceae bacterium]|nr:calcineurin-like phosphoesterase C-terminal domain-containing protein [Muribaculaceae bacterium]